jgi:hypothetical protein
VSSHLLGPLACAALAIAGCEPKPSDCGQRRATALQNLQLARRELEPVRTARFAELAAAISDEYLAEYEADELPQALEDVEGRFGCPGEPICCAAVLKRTGDATAKDLQNALDDLGRFRSLDASRLSHIVMGVDTSKPEVTTMCAQAAAAFVATKNRVGELTTHVASAHATVAERQAALDQVLRREADVLEWIVAATGGRPAIAADAGGLDAPASFVTARTSMIDYIAGCAE